MKGTAYRPRNRSPAPLEPADKVNYGALSRARFAGKHIESRMKFNIKPLNQSNVFDKESLQHIFIV